jgi:transcriptional regulator with GAF, ATPase, and Fis domain
MAGSSAMFKQVVDQLRLAATSDAPVLVEGETGTGKDLAASFIHEHSARRDKPFLTLDCTVLTESLFESEVFGHMRGAFTGAIADKPGLFELADGGTLVLDEIGELSALSQAKLLRVLETGEFRRVGGRKVLHANVRVICATNRCLRSAVQQQGFRQDLFYRVACLPIRMPSLRERLDDIPELVEALLNRIQWRGGRRYSITDKALHWLQSYHFPGNIRELRNILEASAAQSLDGIIGVEQANDVIERSRRSGSRPNTEDPVSRWGMNGTAAPDADNSATLRNLEADYLVKLLETHQGSKREISRLLGISERTLYRKMKRYGIR